jgi:hypothetical protein
MTNFDQQNFNNDISERLGEHGAKLDTLLQRTESLTLLTQMVTTHDTNLRFINRIGSMLGLGIVSALVALLRSKFGSHS